MQHFINSIWVSNMFSQKATYICAGYRIKWKRSHDLLIFFYCDSPPNYKIMYFIYYICTPYTGALVTFYIINKIYTRHLEEVGKRFYINETSLAYKGTAKNLLFAYCQLPKRDILRKILWELALRRWSFWLICWIIVVNKDYCRVKESFEGYDTKVKDSISILWKVSNNKFLWEYDVI